MAHHDRLSALIARFSLRVVPAPWQQANLLVFETPGTRAPGRVVFAPRGGEASACVSRKSEQVMFSARAEWGGPANPLFSALPACIELNAGEDAETTAVVRLLKHESENRRCGSDTVLDRLGEVLLVRLLRVQLERGTTEPGLLGGLADDRLSRAIVAIHESPGKTWRNDELAQVAGLSLSRFSELFAEVVGVTPKAYLRRWRMILARQDIERGDRIQAVAQRYGYGSGEALNRAFRQQFGDSPMHFRRAAS